jgi:uncharacterized protein YutE (UPF0331/DUF86 family)
MSPLKKRLHAECEQIQQALELIPEQLDVLSPLELAGLGSVIHSIYNGLENMLKQIFKEERIELPDSAFWHKELLDRACRDGIISTQTLELLKEYAGLRHFFVHAYCPRLDLERLRPLVEKASYVVDQFLRDIHDKWL